MSKNIKNIKDMREFALETMERLRTRDIDVSEAGVTAKLCETVVSTIKTELEFAKMLQIEPKVEFLRTNNNAIEGEVLSKTKLIEGKKR